MSDRNVELLKSLRDFTAGCRDDMHEPDEQGLTAHVVGGHLDNAFGSHIDIRAVIGGYQEFVVVLHRRGKEAAFNLADLIALARRADAP